MRISELKSDLLLELEVGQTCLMANHSKRNVGTDSNIQEQEMGSERKMGNCQSEALSLCPFSAQPEGSKPGSVPCTRKLHLLSGNLIHLRKGWSSCWHCWGCLSIPEVEEPK